MKQISQINQLTKITEAYMTTKEASEALGISTETVRQWLKTGKLKGKKIGRKWWVERESVQAILEQ